MLSRAQAGQKVPRVLAVHCRQIPLVLHPMISSTKSLLQAPVSVRRGFPWIEKTFPRHRLQA